MKRFKKFAILLAAVITIVCLADVTEVYAVSPSAAPGVGSWVEDTVYHVNVYIYEIGSVVIKKCNDWDKDLVVYLHRYKSAYEYDNQKPDGRRNTGIGVLLLKNDDGNWVREAYQGARQGTDNYYTEEEVRAQFTDLMKDQVEMAMLSSVMEWRDPSSGGETEVKYIDYDTFKSEFASGVVTLSIPGNPSQYFDLKGHAMAKTDAANQMLLAQNFANSLGKKAKEVTAFGIFPRRDLSTAENGAKYVLTWKNLPIKTPGTIYAVCYNQTDGAYILTGTVDATGKAVFSDFRLRAATNVTIFMLQ